MVANIKSAQKRIRVTARQTAVNKSKKTAIKTYIKKFDTALENGNIDEARLLLRDIDKRLKKAAQHNIIHSNAASRKISRLTKTLNRAV